MTSENSCIQAGNSCSVDDIKSGIVVNVKVNNEQTEDFYVLADDGNKLTLILNRNLKDKFGYTVPWSNAEDSSYGPLTVLTELQERTSTWTNLSEVIISEFEDNTDEGIIIKTLAQSFTMYARLPKYSEIYAINNSINLTDTTWLYTNLTSVFGGNYGYWTATASSYSRFYAHRVSSDGYLGSEAIEYSDGGTSNGVRPVIELSK